MQTGREEKFAGYMNPIVYAYTSWVLQKAREDGIRRLYFLARDGYIPYLLAKRIVAEKNIDIDIRYLKVSRYSIRSGEYHLLTEDEILDKVCLNGIDVTFRKICRRALLTDEEARYIYKLCKSEFLPDEVLSAGKIRLLREKLCVTPYFFDCIRRHSKDCYETAVEYLKGEGLLCGGGLGIADSGWVGTLQKSLQHLIDSAGANSTITGYYFGLYEIPAGMSRDRYCTYYFAPVGGIRRKAYFSNCLYEAILSSPEGMTLGYEQTLDGVIVRDSDHPNPNSERIRKTIESIEKMPIGEKPWPIREVERYLSRWMAKPNEEEAEFFGAYLFSDDVLEHSLQKVAASLTEKEIRKQRLIHKLRSYRSPHAASIHESAWIEGSIVSLGRRVKNNLWHARLYKNIMYTRKSVQQWIKQIKKH